MRSPLPHSENMADLSQVNASQTDLPQTDLPKFVLMVQPILSQQGAIWQAALRSQQLSVIWESPDVDLIRSLNQLTASKAALPDLLLIDTRIQRFNAYTLCRWCNQQYPTLKILLVNGAQPKITPSEREWAIAQGAIDLLPRIQPEQLMSGAADRLKRVMQILDQPDFNRKALVATLLKLSRGKPAGFSKPDFSNGN
jgi:CheY-like chemotaxis protein